MWNTIRRPSLTLMLALVAAAQPQEATMHTAKGEFDVEVAPRPLDGPAEDPSFSRFALTKTLRGDLEGAPALLGRIRHELFDERIL